VAAKALGRNNNRHYAFALIWLEQPRSECHLRQQCRLSWAI